MLLNSHPLVSTVPFQLWNSWIKYFLVPYSAVVFTLKRYVGDVFRGPQCVQKIMFFFFQDFMKKPVSFAHSVPCVWWEGFTANLVVVCASQSFSVGLSHTS